MKDALDMLIQEAKEEAQRAMTKFPQPNYTITKFAEESGEVVKAAVHCAEGRETPEALYGEMRQAMAMMFRIFIEGDQVHGLLPVSESDFVRKKQIHG
jgi:CTP-dependent riboflavin kinase